MGHSKIMLVNFPCFPRLTRQAEVKEGLDETLENKESAGLFIAHFRLRCLYKSCANCDEKSLSRYRFVRPLA